MPITYVNDLQRKLCEYQEKVSNDDIYAYLLQTDVEKLLEEAKRFKVYFTALKVEQEVMLELQKVINQIAQFLQDIEDIIQLNRNKSL